ncbi:MAG: hypothetical protein LBP59_10950 [Planctomycetaceae bacterium]|nr:hypothetical protein [Planctomycetaceae bacterium]
MKSKLWSFVLLATIGFLIGFGCSLLDSFVFSSNREIIPDNIIFNNKENNQ